MDKSNLFPGLPASLRSELFDTFNKIITNYARGKWEPSELNGGKFCEVVYSIISGHINGNFPQRASKPNNMVDACRALEQAGSSFPRSLRIQIPRMLIALYEIRNNRGVGHAGSDVDPNKMDAVATVYNSKWILAEMIRVFHGIDIDQAQNVVDSLVERDVPIVWMSSTTKRILQTDLTMKEQMLVLLYSGSDAASEKDLINWIEPRNVTDFRNKVIKPSHKARLVEYDPVSKMVSISPKGEKLVEENILSRLRT
jgi:hypothetical protein